MNVRMGTAVTVAAVTTALLMVCVLPAAAVAAAPPLNPSGSHTVWAYAGVRTVTFSGRSSALYTYEGSATYGYSVILDQTNTSSTTFELYANQTMGAILSIKYCAPNCRNPTATASVDYHAWEATDDWANFTTAGNVSEGGQPTAAIALENSHTTVVGNVTDLAVGPARSDYLATNVSASATVSFATPLGLLPLNLTGGAMWTNTSAFTASGIYSLGYYYHHSGPAGNFTIPPATVTFSASGSGTVTVVGSAAPGFVSLGGTRLDNVSLAVQGPFAVREGFILVPAAVDLFGSPSTPVAGNESGYTSAQLASIYAVPLSGGHFGITGSEWVYDASAINPSVAQALPESSGVDQIASGANQVASTPVQGVPTSADDARNAQTCLVGGSSCPTGTGPAPPHGLLGIVLLGGSAAVIAAVVVVVAERRRVPPPTYPNADLYPPGGSAPSGGAAPHRPRAPPASSDGEDDPLSHLW
jgi:hypothetical protein